MGSSFSSLRCVPSAVGMAGALQQVSRVQPAFLIFSRVVPPKTLTWKRDLIDPGILVSRGKFGWVQTTGNTFLVREKRYLYPFCVTAVCSSASPSSDLLLV